MTEFVFANNVKTTLSAAASSTATTLSVSSTVGLPSIPSGSVFAMTLNDAATGTIFEVVYVTAISGSDLTVERAQEGTAAQSWLVGDNIYGSNTAGILGSFLSIAQAQADYAQLSEFSFNASSNGSETLPDGSIRQWGAGSVTSSGSGISEGIITLPEAFPNGMLWSIAQFSGVSPPPGGSVTSVQGGSTTQVTIYINTTASGTFAVCYECRGN